MHHLTNLPCLNPLCRSLFLMPVASSLMYRVPERRPVPSRILLSKVQEPGQSSAFQKLVVSGPAWAKSGVRRNSAQVTVRHQAHSLYCRPRTADPNRQLRAIAEGARRSAMTTTRGPPVLWSLVWQFCMPVCWLLFHVAVTRIVAVQARIGDYKRRMDAVKVV